MKAIKSTVALIITLVILFGATGCSSSQNYEDIPSENISSSTSIVEEHTESINLISNSLLTAEEYVDVLRNLFPTINNWDMISKSEYEEQYYDGLEGYLEISSTSCSLELFGSSLGLEKPGTVVSISYVNAASPDFSLSVSSEISLEHAISLGLEVFSHSSIALTATELLELYNNEPHQTSADGVETCTVQIDEILIEIKENYFDSYCFNASTTK